MFSNIEKLLNIKRYLNKTLFKTPGVEYLKKNYSFKEKKKKHINFWISRASKNNGLNKYFFKSNHEDLSKDLSKYIYDVKNKFEISNEMFEVLSKSGLLVIENALPEDEREKVINLFNELKFKNYSKVWQSKPTSFLRETTEINVGKLKIDDFKFLKSYSDQATKEIFNKVIEPSIELHYLKLKNLAIENTNIKGETFIHSDRFIPHFKMFYTPHEIGEDDAPFQYALGSHKVTPDYLDFFLNAKSFDETDIESKKLIKNIVSVKAKKNSLYIAFTNGLHRRTPFKKISEKKERNMMFFQYVERFNKFNYLF